MVYANQQQYYDAITANSNAADSGPFIDFMLGEIQKAIEAHKREPIKYGHENEMYNVGVSLKEVECL